MRWYILAAVLVVLTIITSVACLGEVIPYDPATMQYPVTPSQAMAAVRTWTGQADIALTLDGIDVMRDPDRYRYSITTTDGTQEFLVECNNGEVFHWVDIPGSRAYVAKINADTDPATQKTAAELNAAIVTFSRARYADFDALNMQVLDPDEVGSACVQRLPNGVWYPGRHVHCSVDRWTGQVVSYYATRSAPPNVSTVPTITASEAEEIALDYAGMVQVSDCDADGNSVYTVPQSAFVLRNAGLWLCADRMAVQRLRWEIGIVVSPSSDYTPAVYAGELTTDLCVPSGEEVNVFVDANTGEVFYAGQMGVLLGAPEHLDPSAAAKMKSRRPNPSALKAQPRYPKIRLEISGSAPDLLSYSSMAVGKTAYIYAGYLSALYGGAIRWQNGLIPMDIGGTHVVLRAGSREMRINGRTLTLDQPVLIIAGRTYIPHTAIRHLCDADVKWDPKTKTLRLTPGKKSLRKPPPPEPRSTEPVVPM